MSILTDARFEAWARTMPAGLTADPLWRLNVYRVASFVLDGAREDVQGHLQRPPWIEVGSQLLRSAASVPANLAEGYARPTVSDQIRFYAMALGSLRECATWYRAVTSPVGAAVTDGRLMVMRDLRGMLIALQRSLKARGHGSRIM